MKETMRANSRSFLPEGKKADYRRKKKIEPAQKGRDACDDMQNLYWGAGSSTS